jgi:hypothetical protein
VATKHVLATHGSTLELTSDDWLTPAGDCIIAVEADTVPADFPATFVDRCRDADVQVELELAAAGHRTVVTGKGDPDLTFASDRGLVCRTSDHVDDRTVMVNANTAAAELDRDLVTALGDGARLQATLRVS